MAKKTEETSDGGNFEIIRKPSAVKLNRERDRRVQWTTTASMALSICLLVSVCANVYQAISTGGNNYYAQDIRTADLTELTPLTDDQKISGAKMGKFPLYTDEFLARMDAEANESRTFLNSLYDKDRLAAALQALNESVAANQTAAAASAPVGNPAASASEAASAPGQMPLPLSTGSAGSAAAATTELPAAMSASSAPSSISLPAPTVGANSANVVPTQEQPPKGPPASSLSTGSNVPTPPGVTGATAAR